MSRDVEIEEDVVLKVEETPVNLTDKVKVVDYKNGVFIGYRDKEEVMELLQVDFRFNGMDNAVTGEYVLTYNREGNKTITQEAASVLEFLSVIEDNLETAEPADNPKKLRMGVSYVGPTRRNYMMDIHISAFKNATQWLDKALVEAMGAESEEHHSPTAKIIEYLKSKSA